MTKWDLIDQKIEENKDEMIRTLQEFIGFPSVVDEPKDDMPFGENVHEAFSYLLEKGRAEGFDVLNVDNQGGHIEFSPDAAGSGEVLGIIGHVDVVPAGKDWDNDPFEGNIADGKLYGRGASDNKGPTIAAFYAMKALKDAGVMPKKSVRMILGLDEETNWNGMKYYLDRIKRPDFGFVPDSEFPAIHGEMGILFFDIAKKLAKSTEKGLELRSLKGGNAPNMVADHARAVVNSENTEDYEEIKSKAAEFRAQKKAKINCKGVGKSLEIVVNGISAHGSRPELGQNAISLMMDFLGRLSFVNDDVSDFIEFFNTYIGYELDGASLGTAMEDEPSGKLVFNVGVIDMDTKAVKLTNNIRYPVTCKAEDVYASMMPALDKYELGLVKNKSEEPLYIPADDPMIVTLMDIYREHTGDKDSKPAVIGGGTYARMFKNCVAFGPRFPDTVDVAHQKNEFIELDELMMCTKIYADTIYRLTEAE